MHAVLDVSCRERVFEMTERMLAFAGVSVHLQGEGGREKLCVLRAFPFFKGQREDYS